MQGIGEPGRYRGGRPGVAGVRGRDVDLARADPYVGPRHGRLARWDAWEYLEQPMTELGVDPELLVHDGPQYPIGTPCLVKRRALVERLGDVRGEVRRRADLRHRARVLVDRADLERRQGVGVALLVGGTAHAVVAAPHGHPRAAEGVRHLRLRHSVGAGVAPRA